MIAYCEAACLIHCGDSLGVTIWACSKYNSFGEKEEEYISLPFNGGSNYGEIRAILYAFFTWPELITIYSDIANDFKNTLRTYISGEETETWKTKDFLRSFGLTREQAKEIREKLKHLPYEGIHWANHDLLHKKLGNVNKSLLSGYNLAMSKRYNIDVEEWKKGYCNNGFSKPKNSSGTANYA